MFLLGHHQDWETGAGHPKYQMGLVVARFCLGGRWPSLWKVMLGSASLCCPWQVATPCVGRTPVTTDPGAR